MSNTRGTIGRTLYLTVRIAGDEYAIDILNVKEVIRHYALATAPKIRHHSCGMLNLRGRAVPLTDLALKFGLGETLFTKFTSIVVVEVNRNGHRAVMGIMAELVNQVINLSPRDIDQFQGINKVGVDYLKGMGKYGNKSVLILDIDRVFEDIISHPKK